MHKQPSFSGRIILALLLMICFYVLALALAGSLIFLPIAAVMSSSRIPVKIALLSFIGGCMILWSVLPRWDRFIAPGPRMTEADQPVLFEQLRSLAQSTDQSMPSEVYALPEMNAWVANRGGVMGIGSRRIMGIGIPLMQVLSSEQLRGVLAHEFGHYYGGDTKLGPWLFVTRSAIIRTVVNLASSGSSILHLPFQWYLKLFLRLTQKVSRQQEFTADALAAKTVGPQAIGDALKIVYSKAIAFDGFWQNEYSPALERGVRPPMAQGFREYSTAPKIKEMIEVALKQAMEESKSDIYDSHPALKERLESINQVTGPIQKATDPPAIEWIRDVDQLEKQMIDHMAKSVGVSSPDSIAWSESTEKVLIPGYLVALQGCAAKLDDLTLEQATMKLANPKDCIGLINDNLLPHLPDDESKRVTAARIIGFIAILAFKRRGWEILNPIGQTPYVQMPIDSTTSPFQAERSETRLEPFDWIEQFIQRKCSHEDLISIYREHGVESVLIKDILASQRAS